MRWRDSARRAGPWVLASLLLHAGLLWPTHRPSAPLPTSGRMSLSLLRPPAAAVDTRPAPPSPLAAPAPRVPRPLDPRPGAAAAAKPASVSGQPLVLVLPESGSWRYALRWQGEAGDALLQLQQDGRRYTLSLQRSTPSRSLPAWRSEGRIGADGLEPESFQAGRRQWTPPAGVQDRLSWILQAAALAQAQRLRAGQRLRLQVQGWRGERVPWTLLAEPEPTQPTWLRLCRELPEGSVLEQCLWLDLQDAYRPVQLRVRYDTQERWELLAVPPGRDISPTADSGP